MCVHSPGFSCGPCGALFAACDRRDEHDRQSALVHSLGQVTCAKGDHEAVLPCPFCRAAA